MADEFKKKRYKETKHYQTPPYHNYYTNSQLRQRLKREVPRPVFVVEETKYGPTGEVLRPRRLVSEVDED